MANKVKVKTNRSAAKRFKLRNGKVKRKKAYLRHNMRKRSNDAKRQLRLKGYVSEADKPSVMQLLPNG